MRLPKILYNVNVIDMNMRKGFVLAILPFFVLCGCTTSAGYGAYAGAGLGSILGSAIGGIAGGPRGSDIGTLIGMAGGAAVGGAAGSQLDRQRQSSYDDYDRERPRKRSRRHNDYSRQEKSYDDSRSGLDPSNAGDDILYDFNGSDYTGDYSAGEQTVKMPSSSSVEELVSDYAYSPHVDIVNARFVDENHDNRISRGETCKVIFEIYNRGDKPVSNVRPVVMDATGNKHIYISPSVYVESIAPGRGVRYTAIVKADKRLKKGNVRICVSVLSGDTTISKVHEFNISTSK